MDSTLGNDNAFAEEYAEKGRTNRLSHRLRAARAFLRRALRPRAGIDIRLYVRANACLDIVGYDVRYSAHGRRFLRGLAYRSVIGGFEKDFGIRLTKVLKRHQQQQGGKYPLFCYTV